MVAWKKWKVRWPDARYACLVQIRVITPFRSRKRGVQTLFLSGQFGNSAGSAEPDILDDFLSKFRSVEMFM
jgi:hypothetical protein